MLLVAQAGGRRAARTEAIRRALFTEDTPDAWIAEVAFAWPGEPACAARRADLGPAGLVPRPPRPRWRVLGDRDAFVPITDLWGIALAYGAETELMRGCGHGLPIDPHWKSLAWRINAWLDERRIGAGGPPRRRRSRESVMKRYRLPV